MFPPTGLTTSQRTTLICWGSLYFHSQQLESVASYTPSAGNALSAHATASCLSPAFVFVQKKKKSREETELLVLPLNIRIRFLKFSCIDIFTFNIWNAQAMAACDRRAIHFYLHAAISGDVLGPAYGADTRLVYIGSGPEESLQSSFPQQCFPHCKSAHGSRAVHYFLNSQSTWQVINFTI